MTEKNDAGFTLLELLISMAVVGLLTVLMFSSLSFGTKVWERSQNAAIDLNRLRLAQESLQADLTRLYPKSLGVAGERYIDFDGEPTSVTYLRANFALPGAFEHVTVSLARDPMAMMEQSVPELGISETQVTKRLLTGVERIQMSYFGPGPDADKTPQWWPTWKGRSTPPLLIRLRLARTGNGAWAEMTAAPRIEADVNCIYDPLTKSCQGRS